MFKSIQALEISPTTMHEFCTL